MATRSLAAWSWKRHRRGDTDTDYATTPHLITSLLGNRVRAIAARALSCHVP
jgi:hypothetical protein